VSSFVHELDAGLAASASTPWVGALRRHEEISGQRDMALSELVGEIDSKRQQGNLSSAIRLFVAGLFPDPRRGRDMEAKPQG